MNSLVLGRYVAYDSFIHRLDPRNKILSLIALMVVVFFQFSTYEISFIVEGFIFIFVIFLMCISHIRIIDFIKSLKAVWILLLLLFIINVFIPVADKEAYGVAFYIKDFAIWWASIYQSIKIAVRVVLMIALTMILTATTKPLDLTFALEWFFTPLKVFRFPAHEIAMTLSIALRFIPTILEETDRIMKAQSSRGVDFKHGKLSVKVRALTSLIVPLFVSAFERSEQLADAMEARGYDPRAKRTRYRSLSWGVMDTLTIILSFALLGGAITMNAFNVVISTTYFIPSLILFLEGFFVILVVLGIINSCLRKKAN